MRGALEDLDVYGVVNCGGDGGEIATPMDTDISVFDRVISVNARGALLVTKYASASMIRSARAGRSSTCRARRRWWRSRGHISYGSSKAALDNITRVPRSSSGATGSASTA